MTESVTHLSQGVPTDRRRWTALYVLCAGMLMIILDATIVNVALPSIQNDLGFTQSGLAWVVNAYLIAFGGLLLLAGRLGDLSAASASSWPGSRVFTVASLLCGDRPGSGDAGRRPVRPGGRRRDGLGGDPRHDRRRCSPSRGSRPRPSASTASSPPPARSIGLLPGGVLTQALNWHWIFFVNMPIGVATASWRSRLVAARQGIGLRAGADVLGAVLVTGALMLGVYTIVGAGDHGWASAHTLGLGARRTRACWRLRRPPGDRREPADAAADLPLAERLGRQRWCRC